LAGALTELQWLSSRSLTIKATSWPGCTHSLGGLKMTGSSPDEQQDVTNGSEVVDLSPLEKPSTIQWHRETIREKIALLLTYSIIAITVIPVLAVIVFPASAAAIKEVAASIIPAAIGIYGTIIGFYFGRDK
jgi:hypothetical protein